MQSAIEASFHKDIDHDEKATTEGVLKLVTNIVNTLDLVINELIPQMPRGLQIIKTFTEAVHLMS